MWGVIGAGVSLLAGDWERREASKQERIKAESQIKIEEAKQATERLRIQSEEDQKIREMKEKQYERAHQITLQQIQEENAKSKREAQAKMEQTKQLHTQRLKQMQIDKEERDKNKKIQQKNAGITRMQSEIDKLEELINIDITQLEIEKTDLEKSTKELDSKQLWINKFDSYKQLELTKISERLQLKTAKLNFERDDQQIKSAINKTGQQQTNVGTFLRLTHCLLGATVATTANSNKLQCQISTFDELIRRECNDQLSIEQYFYQINLQRFVSILAECPQKYVNVGQLKCEANDCDEYEEILSILHNGLQQQLDLELEQKNESGQTEELEIESDDMLEVEEKQSDSVSDVKGEQLAVQLLTSWGLMNKWDKMKENEWTEPKDWTDLIEDKDELKAMGFKGGAKPRFIREYKAWLSGNKPLSENMLRQKEKYPLLLVKEMRIIKQICFEPESWMKYEKEQTEAVKDGLMVFSPLLSQFFSRMHEGIKQSQQILNYEITLNNEQRKAIKMSNALPPQSEYKQESESNDTFMTDIRKDWKISSKCEIYSDSNKRWYNGQIIGIDTDNEGEWFNVRYGTNKIKQIGRFSQGIRPMQNDNKTKLALQCRALTTAAIISIDVTDSMMDEFNQNIVTMRALTVARGVEDCCMQIIKAQSTIRQSVLLAQEILKFRPAFMSQAAKVLWAAVDKGCIRIMKSAINMTKVSAQYFKFFLRFQSSFQFYEANRDKSLMVSLQYVHKDCREFTAFRQEFDGIVQELSNEAMDCITNCVGTMVGASNFEKAKSSREITLKKWLGKKEIYDAKVLELDEEFERAQIQKINISAERARLHYKVSILEEVIKSNQEDKRNYVEAKSVLDKMVI